MTVGAPSKNECQTTLRKKETTGAQAWGDTRNYGNWEV